MNLFRAWLKMVGPLPLLLIAFGAVLFFRHSRAWWIPAWAGILWLGYNVLYAKREISATVTEGTPTVTWTEG